MTKSGTGGGTVTSKPLGISCGTDCKKDYTKGEVVTLTATANKVSKFTGWGGDADCKDGKVVMDSDKTCKVDFAFGLFR